MPEINANFYDHQQQLQPQTDYYSYYGSQTYQPQPLTVRDEFVREHKKNGLFERLYNGIKNLTGLGVGSKKAQAAVNRAENGEISDEEARNTITKYRNSQANSEQIFGDALSIGASAATFFGLRKVLKTEGAAAVLNEKFYTKITKNTPANKWAKKLINLSKSKTKMTVILAGVAGLAGGITKLWTGRINRIGSKEYSTNKKDFNNLATEYDTTLYKIEKKTKRRQKRNANFRNFVSGAINGLMMPVTLVGGAFAGVAAYLGGNTLNRYFIGNHAEKNKTFGSYFDNLKNDGVMHGALAVGAAIPMIKKGRWHNLFDKNLKTSFEKLKAANLKDSGFEGKTIYQELESILMDSKDVSEIVNMDHKKYAEMIKNKAREISQKEGISFSDAYDKAMREVDFIMEETITKLTEENIFAVKMKQIAKDGSELTKALRESCPRTYTTEEAADIINRTFSGKYKVTKSLGAGTIAETYLAEAKDGSKVCIKLLKKGITKEKILNDEKKFIEIIENLEGKTREEKDLLIKNIKNLSEGIQNEVNFEHEMEAAKKLAEHTKAAKVVKPIEVKDSIYVMECAEGISLESFAKINALQFNINAIEKSLLSNPENKYLIRNLKELKAEFEKIKEKTPNFEKITELTPKESEKLLNAYQRIKIEQFNQISKDGKTIHADIHPGNIFFDIDAFKAGKKQFFTLIDTGNTIDMTKEQALRALKLTDIVRKGNVQDLTEYVLEGADLGMSRLSKDEAVKKISEELNKVFFDYETKLETMTNDSVLNLTSNIMRKYKILPNDNQLNFNKAKQSAGNSFEELMEILLTKKFGDFNLEEAGIMEGVAKVGELTALLGKIVIKNKQMEKLQEQANLALLSPAERKKFKNNPNSLKGNDEKLLTYKLKQKMKDLTEAESKINQAL